MPAICVEKQPKQSVFCIPSLGMETAISGAGDVALNDTITVKASKIDLPLLEAVFVRA